MKLLKLLFTLVFVFVSFVGFTQWGENDHTFNTSDSIAGYGKGANASINDAAILPDGKVVMVGDFFFYNKQVYLRIVQTDSSGNIDTSFKIGDGFNGDAHCVAVQADGKILVGGDFTTYDNKPVSRFVRLHPDGALDTTFKVGNSANQAVFTINILPNNKILVGGVFNEFNDTTARGLVRLNLNGTIDNTFERDALQGGVKAVAFQPDGKLIVVGTFLKYKTNTAQRIARLDSLGNLDTTFKSGSGFSHDVECVALQPDGKVLVGGFFTTYDGTSSRRFIRLNTDGSIDNSFSIGSGFDRQVYSVVVLPDSNIVVSGFFDEYDGVVTRKLVRLNPNGTLNTGTKQEQLLGPAFTILEMNDGRLFFVGSFTTYGGKFRFNALRTFQTGEMDFSFNIANGFDFDVHKVTVQNDGKILVGGQYSIYNGKVNNSLVRLLPNGKQDTTFKTGEGFSAVIQPSDVRHIVVQPNGKILVAGFLTFYNNVKVKHLVRLHANGELDTTFDADINFSPTAIALQKSGKILVGYSSGLVRLNKDGSQDGTLSTGSGFNSNVSAIKILPDDAIIIAGNFTTYKGNFHGRIVKIDSLGTVDNSFNTGNGFNGRVMSLAYERDGHILVGGYNFSTYDGVDRNGLARLDSTGKLDANFNPLLRASFGQPFSHEIHTIIPQSDKKILVAGRYLLADSSLVRGVVRFDSTGKVDTAFKIYRFNDNTNSIALQGEHNIIAVGIFTSYNSIARNGIARINNCVVSEETIYDTACANTIYTFNGISYSKDTIAKFSYINNGGCDSLVTLHLTFLKLAQDSVSFSFCDSFTSPSGKYIWKTTGMYQDTLVSSKGCDSIIYVDLTINNTSLTKTTISSCVSYLSPSGKYTWNASGTYYDTLSSSGGCDSILEVALTINPTFLTTQTTSVCQGDSIMLGGVYQTTAGTYYDSLKSAAGCDSIVETTLTINPTYLSQTTASICGYDSLLVGGNYVKIAGIYYDSLKSSLGCDSIVEITVNDNSINVGQLSKFGPSGLQSKSPGDKYVWLDCDNNYSSINGPNQQTILNLKNGRYAVEVTRDGCIDTSECSSINVGLDGPPFANTISVYPNPTSNILTIGFNKEYGKISLEIITLTGQVVKSTTLTNRNEATLDVKQYPRGIYFLNITADGKQATKRITVQ